MRIALASIACKKGSSFARSASTDAQDLVGGCLPLQSLVQSALRVREAALEIGSGFLPDRGRPMPSRLDAEGEKFYVTLGNRSMA